MVIEAGWLEPPYYVAMLTTWPSDDQDGYAEMSERMNELAPQQPGYLGESTFTSADGGTLSLVYYSSLEAVVAWRDHAEHLEAKRLGKQRWFRSYQVRIAKVEHAYHFDSTQPTSP